MEDARIKEVADELYQLAESVGIETALKLAFDENVAVSLEIPKSLLDSEIIMFDFPQRFGNVLSKWCKIHENKPRTVERIVSLVSMGDYAKEFVAGYGKRCRDFLKTFLLIQSYERYSEEQKRKFCYNTVLMNCEME